MNDMHTDYSQTGLQWMMYDISLVMILFYVYANMPQLRFFQDLHGSANHWWIWRREKVMLSNLIAFLVFLRHLSSLFLLLADCVKPLVDLAISSG